MSAEVTKRTEKFLWVGNTPSLDFVNTAIVQAGRPVDLLASGLDLAQWLRESGLLRVPQSATVPLLEAALRVARVYRQILRVGMQTLVDRGWIAEKAIVATNDLLAAKAGCDLLVADRNRVMLKRRWDLNSVEGICAPIAQSFAQFISTADMERVHRCKNPECVLFFYDVSKSGTRSWCSLATCGNKLRVAAFRKRLKDG